ncbi:MAG: preprotein translocase subunit SecY [Lachnospiraceae bacterium]|nr:preprotein translocase subunit SecY [Lachnospiraceae bacterium]MDO4530039.1 preprotein translocase subunit SecY [Lachnospiraceae bacterium]MDO4734131.1 preprotein translocase subunit SecY [Lachnospiraceae bacterium]
MFKTIVQAFKVKEIRKRILYTVVMLIIVRIGCQLPLPGTDAAVIKEVLGGLSSGAFGFFDALTGSSFSSFSVFALNITVYITASIIIQLLTIAIPKLEELQKEGEDGRQKIAKITRYLTVGLGLVESIAMVVGFGNQGIFGSLTGGMLVWTMICDILILTAGATIIMWMGEQITEKGIGNGISIILLVNIVSTMPNDFSNLYQQFVKGASSVGMAVLAALIIIAVVVFVVAFIVYLNDGERRIAVQYSQKMVGRKSYGGQSSHIPLKVNTAGVIPIIFAASLFQFPVIIANFATGYKPGTWTRFFMSSYWCNPHYPIYSLGLILYVALIVFFAYFYTQITFNPTEVANNIKKQGGFVPGIRPGKPTEDYFKKVLKYLIFIGAVGLIIIAIIPMIISGVFNAQLSFAGTSMIIVVGVILETAKKLESMLLVRNYSGFLAKQ